MAKRKVTMLLPTETVEELKRMVDEGVATSQGAAVREAVAEYAARRKQEWLRAEYEAAARDPAFLSDVKEVMDDFRTADEEMGIRLADEDRSQ